MNPVKSRFYYDSVGHVFFKLDLYGETTIEKDISDFKTLSERNRESFNVLELPFGAYAQDFAESNSYHVNPETKELEFSYPDPNEPEVEQPYQAPLSVEVAELKSQNEMLMIGVADTYETQQANVDMLLNAVAEVYEIILGGA